jgi:hypothetical protein
MNPLRPRRLRRDITAVVFSCDESGLSRFSVESGPCVALTEGGKSLVSPLAQHGGETPSLTAALYSVLTDRPASEALRLVDRIGKGRLSECSAGFVDAMAACSEESLRLADEDDARGDRDLTSFIGHLDAVSTAWMRAGRWPREVVSLQNRLVRMATAREAAEKGKKVFVWHGTPVPQFVIASGSGPYTPPR